MDSDETSPEKLRVLIADDVLETRRATRLMLAENPLVEIVAIAHDGKEAIELAQKHRPDIALLDINMPEIDGFSAFEAMRELNPDIVCIIISAERNRLSFRTAMSIGASEYLIKPFTFYELDNAIKKLSQIIKRKRDQSASVINLREQREAYLQHLAHEYAKSRRTDDQAIEVFEELAKDPNCKLRWLRTLAMVYIIREDWKRLLPLAIRLARLPD
ncbi:MAG: hypothetical protein B6I38_07750 [Anaerolineaceae bacterium 4572_5.1]|nr:MAG: hypothetical protein B6I38_07750 [Anaerolineaceae bacterium 4572_5.1]